MLAAGWLRNSRSLAARTLPVVATATKTSSWRGLIACIRIIYTLDKRFSISLSTGEAQNIAGQEKESPVSAVAAPSPSTSRLPGIVLAFAVAAVAFGLGRLMPLVGGAVCGIVLGILVRQFAPPSAMFQPGIRFASKQVLQWSIVALGFGLSITQVAHTGLESLRSPWRPSPPPASPRGSLVACCACMTRSSC